MGSIVKTPPPGRHANLAKQQKIVGKASFFRVQVKNRLRSSRGCLKMQCLQIFF